MRRNTCSLVLIALSAAVTPALHAQGRDRGLVEVSEGAPLRSGFYITGGLGDGLDQVKFDDGSPYSDWQSSPAAVLRFGGTASESVRIGGELFGWWHSFYDADPALQENATEYFTAVLLDAQVYPSPRNGFYLKGGIGIAHSGTNYEFDGDASGNGFAFSVGAGYDIPLSRWVSIAPTVDFYQASFSNPPDPSGLSNSYTEHVLNIGASLTFQGRHRY